jgi:hypothetical protein
LKRGLGHQRLLLPPTQAELNNLLQFQPGDDWLSLVKKLRP